MSKPVAERCCLTCRHATWQRSATGSINRNKSGSCNIPIQDQPLPLSITDNSTYTPLSIKHRCGIWASDRRECPTWEVKAWEAKG